VEYAPLLLLISGPAGSGKTTLCDRLIEEFKPGLQRVITATTRSPRSGEIDGIDYHFLKEDEFLKRVRNGEFYEHAQVHSGYYGTLKSEIQNKLASQINLILNIDVQGASTFRNLAKNDPQLARQLKTLFVQPSSIDQIRQRLLRRGKDSADEIERRLITAETEMAEKDHFDHILQSASREEDYQNIRAFYLAASGVKVNQ
jgi:guanylate kinase